MKPNPRKAAKGKGGTDPFFVPCAVTRTYVASQDGPRIVARTSRVRQETTAPPLTPSEIE